MKDNFLQIIQQNRERLDTEQPSAEVWKKLEQQLPAAGQQSLQKNRVLYIRWAVAASIAMLLMLSFMWLNSKKTNKGLAARQPGIPVNNERETVLPVIQDTGAAVTIAALPVETASGLPAKNKTVEDPQAVQEAAYIEEPELIRYFAGQVVKQHKKLEHLSKNGPGHTQFLAKLEVMDSAYQRLESKLQQMPHNRQLLEAISELLQVQLNVINKQIDQLKQLKTKKNETINDRT